MSFDVNDIIGKKFGRLTVVKFDHKKKKNDNRHYYNYYLCRCDCGNLKIVERAKLIYLHTQSCGCLHKEKFKTYKHGLSYHRLHRIWDKMKYRCYNPKCPRYSDYGGRGIIICDTWKNNFKAFYDWAVLNGYKENLTIDRINVNGNYEPSNCRWVSQKVQSRNTRKNHYITYKGQTYCLSDWANKYNILPDTLWMRIKRGWTIEKALTKPIQKHISF